MRKGSLKLLLSAGLVALGTAVYAASPVLDALPTVVISDAENQSSTEDWNLFVFSDAFAFGDYVEDADTPDALLKWTFEVAAGGVGDISINDIDSTTAGADDPANPASPINTSDATFREIALSPGLAADPINTPFPTPSEITPSMGQPADIDGDGNDDKLVGELVVTFYVADDQNDLAKVDSDDTFVWTYDTDLGGASRPGDALIDPGLAFEGVDLVLGTGSQLPGNAGWFYNAWSDTNTGNALTEDWLTDAVSGTQGTSPFDAFEITGAGDSGQSGSFGAAHGEWLNPGDPKSLFQAGNVYAARAALGFAGGVKDSSDQPRIGIQENTVANVNQTYVINAPTNPTGITGDHPFLPATGTTKEYLSTVDPIDADLAFNDVIGDGSDLYYLFKFDFVNIIAVAVRTASMASFEVGNGDSASYNADASAVMTYGDGTGENGFDDWDSITPTLPLGLIGGATLLTDVNSATATAGSVVIVVDDQTVLSTDISFGEMSNFNGEVGDIGDLDVVEGAAYRADYSIAVNGGSAGGVSTGNTYGIPSLRLRAATPIPSFSIEYIITPRNTNGFPTEDTPAIHELYWTASTQYPTGTSVGEEDDQQVIFGVQDFEWTDGTVTLDGLTIYQVNSSDPNVDY